MQPTRQPNEKELIALVAMMFATIALSIDAMLPALSLMATELTPAHPERITLVVGVFIFGMGLGTLFAGPMSDAFGRKPVILSGFAIYILGAIWSATSTDLTWMLVGRFIQGIAVAGPRIASTALVRDLYKGERMATVMSFVMMIFVLVPAVAPLIGQAIMVQFGWRSIFVSFTVFAAAMGLWMNVRQPETHPPKARVSISPIGVWKALLECLTHRVFRYSLLVMTLVNATLFGLVSTIQPIYEKSFGIVEHFPLWFAAGALLSMPASFINGRFVSIVGMRKMVKAALIGQVASTLIALILFQANLMVPIVFFLWCTSLFFSIGLVFGNLNALALEPLGHIAGLAASINAAVSTVISAILAIIVALQFDGTPLNVLLAALIYISLALFAMIKLGNRPS